MQRSDGRSFNQLRSLTITKDRYGYASSSLVLEVGDTKVLCSITLQPGVPPFLRGKQTGWLTAEYALLPCATQERTQRATSLVHRNGRTIEISRLISRALRAVVNLDALPDMTVLVDCDVLQADGGTRTASISASYLALALAQEKWLAAGSIKQPFLIDAVAAVSVGIIEQECILDPCYAEDSAAVADINYVLTKSGTVIEVQGGVEKRSISWDLFEKARLLAIEGVNQWFDVFEVYLRSTPDTISFGQEKQSALTPASHKKGSKNDKVPLFSLHNRLSMPTSSD
jgi:ribonuclease PH